MAALVRHPVRGDIRLVAQPPDLSRTPATVDRALPNPGEHNDEILREAGYDEDAIGQLRRSGAI